MDLSERQADVLDELASQEGLCPKALAAMCGVSDRQGRRWFAGAGLIDVPSFQAILMQDPKLTTGGITHAG